MREEPATENRRTPISGAPRKTMREYTANQGTDLAAALYFAVPASFPALLAVVSLLGPMGQQDKCPDPPSPAQSTPQPTTDPTRSPSARPGDVEDAHSEHVGAGQHGVSPPPVSAPFAR